MEDRSFVINDEMFGCYAKIPYGHFYSKTGEKHIFKVIDKFQSTLWCETPITYQTENNPVHHEELEDVINVIHCGIDETKVIRVALKDCEIIKPKMNKLCQWIHYDYRTICPKYHDGNNLYWRMPENTDKLKYCPYCGKEIVIVE